MSERQQPRTTMRCLKSEAMPSVVASTAIFNNAPEGLKEVRFTVRTAAICMTGGSAPGTPKPATTTVGLDFAVNSGSSPYVIECTAAVAQTFRAIQSGGTAAGYIEYWG